MVATQDCERMIRSLGWDGLRALWDNIENRSTPGWDPGQAFEYLVIRAFQLDGARVKWPYTVRLFDEVVEQIDGAVHCAGLSCLVESKDFADKAVDINPIAKLRNQLLRRPVGTVGLLFSRTGFTNAAVNLSCFSLPQAILLWNGDEIRYALEQERICELLTLKYCGAVEYGVSNYNVILRGI